MTKVLKSTFALVLSAIMIAGLLIVPGNSLTRATAAENGISSVIPITLETVEAAAGTKNVGVKVFIPTGWSGIGLNLNFDASKLTFKRFEQNMAVQHQARDGEPNTYVLNKNNATSGEVIVAFASAVVYNGVEGYCNVDVDDDQEYDYFGIAVFDVAADAYGVNTITATVTKLQGLVDGEQVDLDYSITNGAISVPVPPHDHDYGEWQVRTPATCAAAGEKYRVCSICQDEETEVIDIDPDAHDWSEWTPIEGRDGWEQRVCANDPTHVEEREIPFDGITVDIETVNAAAGTKNVGVKIFIPTGWSGIGLNLNFDPAKLTFKRFEQNMAVQHQARDGEPNTYVLNKNNATSGEVIVAFASAVVYNGVEGYCNVDVDDDTVYDYFGIAVFDVAADAEGLLEITGTITKLQGLVNGEQVDLNSRVLNGGINIPTCDHNWVETGRIDPTCTTAGKITYTCSICSESKEEDIEALGHLWGDWTVTTPATCTAAGEETRVCDRCKETDTRVINALGHDWGEWIVVKEATKEEDGISRRVCKNDPNHFEEEVIPKLPANLIDVTIETVRAEAGAKNVPVKIFIPTGWSGIGLNLNFDPAKLTFKRFEQNMALQHQARDGEPNTYVLNKNNADSGEVIVAFASAVVYNGVEGYCNVDVDDDTVYDYFGIAVFDVAADAEGLLEITGTITKLQGLVDGEQVDLPYRVFNGGISFPTCDHEWGEWVVTTEPTCTEKGVKTRTCALCEETETEDIDALGHDYVPVVTKPTCTEAGYTTYTCSRCEDSYIADSVTALGHDWGEWTASKPATCTEPGVETRICGRCGETETRDTEIDPEAHTWVEIGRVPASCVATGTVTYACSGCLEEKTETLDIDPDGHEWGEWVIVKEATPEEDGLRRRVCVNDPSHIEEEVIPKTGCPHRWSEWQTIKAPTYTETGLKIRVCAICGEVEEKIIPKLVLPGEGLNIIVETVDANPSDSDVAVKVFIPTGWSGIDAVFNFDPAQLTFKSFILNPALLEQAGAGDTNVYMLNRTNAASGKIILAFASAVVYNGVEGYCNVDEAGNVYDYLGTFTFDVAPGADGLQEVTATIRKLVNVVNDSTVAVDYEVTNGGISLHNWVISSHSDATCTEPGIVVWTCTSCGKTRQETSEALGHNWSEWEVTKAATCAEDGEEARICTRCNEIETRVIPASEGDHVWSEWEVTLEPTCTTAGEQSRICSKCNTVESKPIPALNHAYTSTVTEPTCSAAGYTTYTCSRCGNTFTVTGAPALGHEWSEWEVTKAATCIATGEEARICTRCGEIETRSIARTEHSWSRWEVVIPNTYKTTGEEARICSVCGELETRTIPVAQVTSIEFTSLPDKTKYTEGSELDFTGAELAINYDNGTTRTATVEPNGDGYILKFGDDDVPEFCTVTGFDSSVVSDQVVTLDYNGTTVSFPIQVAERSVTGIEFVTMPTKYRYELGEALNLNGGSVIVYYDNGTSETARMVTIAGLNRLLFSSSSVSVPLNVSGFDSTSRGRKTVTLEYDGITATFPVRVGGLLGDVDEDGEITIVDSLMVLRVVAELDPTTVVINELGDVDFDDQITVVDSLMILRVVAELDPPFDPIY